MSWSREDKLMVAERLKRIRKTSDLSQEKMAEIIGISLSGYKKIENGSNNLTIAELKKIKEHFGLSADYILFGDEQTEDTMWNVIGTYDESKRLDILLRLMILVGNGKIKW